MPFAFDEDETALADGVEDLLLGRAKGDYARAVASGEADWRDLWEAVSELGIPAMAAPEGLGGLGLGPIELVAVCERVGRHLGPAPIVATAGGFVPTAVAAGVGDAAGAGGAAAAGDATGAGDAAGARAGDAAGAGDGARTGDAAAAGAGAVPTVGGVSGSSGIGAALAAVAEDGAAATLAWIDATDPATIELRDGRLVAADVTVPDAERVDWIGFVVVRPSDVAAVGLADDAVPVVTGQAEDATLAIVAAADLEIAAVEGFDRTRPLALVSTPADGIAASVAPLPNGLADLAVAFATAAAELVGLAARMLELSVEHARERRQFGVPIGSFQGVKHQLADALVELERARSLTYRAAVVCAGEDRAAALAAARMAKAAASDAATEVGRVAVQVHGGIGITVEADVSLFYLRARQASMQLGGRDAHYAALRR